MRARDRKIYVTFSLFSIKQNRCSVCVVICTHRFGEALINEVRCGQLYVRTFFTLNHPHAHDERDAGERVGGESR